MNRSGPKKEPHAAVIWEEVWQWLDEVEKRWGYSCNVVVSRPLGTNKKPRFTVALSGRRLNLNDPRKDSTVMKWRTVEQKGLTAEVVALQMAVELHQKLDNEEYEAERAALEAGALL